MSNKTKKRGRFLPVVASYSASTGYAVYFGQGPKGSRTMGMVARKTQKAVLEALPKHVKREHAQAAMTKARKGKGKAKS